MASPGMKTEASDTKEASQARDATASSSSGLQRAVENSGNVAKNTGTEIKQEIVENPAIHESQSSKRSLDQDSARSSHCDSSVVAQTPQRTREREQPEGGTSEESKCNHGKTESHLTASTKPDGQLDNIAEDVNKQINAIPRCVECMKEELSDQVTSESLAAFVNKMVSQPRLNNEANVSGQNGEQRDLAKKTEESDVACTSASGLSFGDARPKTNMQSSEGNKEVKTSDSEHSSFQPKSEKSGRQDVAELRDETRLLKSGNTVERTPSDKQDMSHKPKGMAVMEENAQKATCSLGHTPREQETSVSMSIKSPVERNHADSSEQHQTSVQTRVQEQQFVEETSVSMSAKSDSHASSSEQHPTNVRTRVQEQQFVQEQFPRGSSQTISDLHADSYGRSFGSHDLQLVASTPAGQNFHAPSSPLFPHGDSVDGILSTLYKLERGLQDISKGPTVWQRLSELQAGPSVQHPCRVRTEAFVTLARSNADVLGCLVLGASLLLCGTSRTLCVLIADEVSPTFMPSLTSIYHEVQHIRSLESLGTTKLSLLDQPELGICFSKLNVWRLEQFQKCVFLSPDTLVVQNCDELFCHEELSAVPDTGWPDCFNSAVFVYRPSIHTFWQLLEFAEKEGSYDGGDQGLLNAYFDTWAQDIHKKLSFIYNLMANVSYTYTPAFKQFGRNVKIVQFVGPYKPWHVKFYNSSGQIASSTSVHPTYVQFVYVWLCVFRTSILPLFSQEIQTYVSSQNVASAHELLRFFPSDMDSDGDFFLAPPSVRLRPAESPVVLEKLLWPARDSVSLASLPMTPHEGAPEADEVFAEEVESSPSRQRAAEEVESSPSLQGADEEVESSPTLQEGEGAGAGGAKWQPLLPGAEVGDYQGMSAWEQGRMDYEGAANSDAIIQRLNFLMKTKDRLI